LKLRRKFVEGRVRIELLELATQISDNRQELKCQRLPLKLRRTLKLNKT
jgi:hypothetical protein